MVSDPELAALLEQAARNLDSLELLLRSAGDDDPEAVARLREQLQQLKLAYTTETDALTRQVLARAVDRRVRPERRRQPAHEVAADTGRAR
jgi:hypothetical protein